MKQYCKHQQQSLFTYLFYWSCITASDWATWLRLRLWLLRFFIFGSGQGQRQRKWLLGRLWLYNGNLSGGCMERGWRWWRSLWWMWDFQFFFFHVWFFFFLFLCKIRAVVENLTKDGYNKERKWFKWIFLYTFSGSFFGVATGFVSVAGGCSSSVETTQRKYPKYIIASRSLYLARPHHLRKNPIIRHHQLQHCHI